MRVKLLVYRVSTIFESRDGWSHGSRIFDQRAPAWRLFKRLALSGHVVVAVVFEHRKTYRDDWRVIDQRSREANPDWQGWIKANVSDTNIPEELSSGRIKSYSVRSGAISKAGVLPRVAADGTHTVIRRPTGGIRSKKSEAT